MSNQTGTTCRGCGKPIVWVNAGTSGNPVHIPVDPRPPIYRYDLDTGMGEKLGRGLKVSYGVSHFATCPKADEFSRSRKKKDQVEVSS